MSWWEYRSFAPRTRGLTAAALGAAQLSRDGPETRADDYYAWDDDHGLKRRGGAADCAQLELKKCEVRLPDGCEQISQRVVKRRHNSDGWRDANGPLEPAVAAAVDVAVKQPPLRVEKQRWAARRDDGVSVEVTKLNLGGDKWLTLCCEGSDAAAVVAAGASLQRTALAAAGLPPVAARVCSYAAWVCEQRARQAAAV